MSQLPMHIVNIVFKIGPSKAFVKFYDISINSLTVDIAKRNIAVMSKGNPTYSSVYKCLVEV